MILLKRLIQMNKERVKKLQAELQRTRNELYMFYEITQAMRSTLNYDEILYIILTSITSHYGLGFNRAALFTVDHTNRKIKGMMGIGPYEPKEAEEVWQWIQGSKKSLQDLIKEYRWLKEEENKPKFFKLVEKLEVSFSPYTGTLYEVFIKGRPIHIKKENIPDLETDWLYKIFGFDEAVLVPLWSKNNIIAVLFTDNFITHKEITGQDLHTLTMFTSQAALAIENSKTFEDTLFKSHTDSLTDLWNYGYFQYKLEEQINYAFSHRLSFGLFMIDIDDFKSYNDTYGHLEGDKTLITITQIIKDSCRKQDIVCRYGGEEFVVILPEIDKKEAGVIAERIRESIERAEDSFNHKVTVSIGISVFGMDAQDKEALISKADFCLYQAKQFGKNKVISA